MADEDSNLANMARDIRELRSMLTQVLNAVTDAETEIPEKMRRFTMYYHDVKDFVDMYHSIGVPCPDYILREIERCDDRYRQMLEDLNKDLGAFERVRREMSKREGNRYDHTRLLSGKDPQ